MRLPVLRRACAAASLFLAVISAAACQKPDQGETKVLVIGDTPKVVDPSTSVLTTPQKVLLTNVAQGLVRFDAAGQIVPGLAERWNVTDDGLSYIFRLQSIEWPDGRKVTAEQVARILRRQLASRSKNALKDSVGAIDQIVPMTDRVIEITLKAPRPHLLQLLAQPEFAVVRGEEGTGPFRISDESKPNAIVLIRTVANEDEEIVEREEAVLSGRSAGAAVQAFLRGDADLVLGGTFDNLPYARGDKLPKNALRFDPASGLFGLIPARAKGPAADPDIRRLLSQAIDRQALIDALSVPRLLPRVTVLEPGLEGIPDSPPPLWTTIPIEQRQMRLAASAKRLFGEDDERVIRVAVPDTPGARILLARLSSDWGSLGLKVEAAEAGKAADFEVVDAVAPSNSPAWYLRSFRCDKVPICDPEADELLDGARAATVAAQRNALFLQAAQKMDDEQLFIALTAPIRWSLVSDRVQGFATNRFARHTLTSLGQQPDRERGE